MPGDAQHNKTGSIVCGLLTLPMIFFGLDISLIVTFVVAYMFVTRYLSPDLDINSKPYQRWGALRGMFYLYMKTFKHRQMSHNLILGPISIMLYVALIVIPILYLFVYMLLYALRHVAILIVPTLDAGIIYMQTPSNIVVAPSILVVVVAAVFAAGWTHIITDKVAKGERQS